MSSGSSGIARVEIKNGSVAVLEVWGGWCPDRTEEHSIELRMRFTEHQASAGNIHAEPEEHDVSVFLTRPQLLDLTRQLFEEMRRHERDARAEGKRAEEEAPF